MIVVAQRASSASVRVVSGEGVGHKSEIGRGLVLLVGAETGDTGAEADWCADKCAGLRVFPDAEGKMNVSVKDMGGAALVVSQFTLAGDASKGRRPSFVRAAAPGSARPLVERFALRLETEHGLHVGRGVFGADMAVELVNDGPVTIIIERRAAEGE